MVVSDTGKNRIRDLVEADISEVKLGTGTTAATAGDTDLETEVAVSAATPTKTKGNKLINVQHILLSTVGTGTNYTEIGVYMNSGATLLSRSVYPAYSHTASLQLNSISTFRQK